MPYLHSCGRNIFLGSCTQAHAVYYISTKENKQTNQLSKDQKSQINLLRNNLYTSIPYLLNHFLKIPLNINSFMSCSESIDRQKLEKKFSLFQSNYFIYSLLAMNLLVSCHITRLMLMMLEGTHNK